MSDSSEDFSESLSIEEFPLIDNHFAGKLENEKETLSFETENKSKGKWIIDEASTETTSGCVEEEFHHFGLLDIASTPQRIKILSRR